MAISAVDPCNSSVEAADHRDLGEKAIQQVENHEHVDPTNPDFTWTAEEERKMVRKVDAFLLPTIWLMYLLSYMDRTK